MAAPKRTRIQIKKERELISAWHLEGLSQTEIAERLHLSQGMINREIKIIEREWERLTAINRDKKIVEKLAEIALLKKKLLKVGIDPTKNLSPVQLWAK